MFFFKGWELDFSREASNIERAGCNTTHNINMQKQAEVNVGTRMVVVCGFISRLQQKG
jgi:hypothetical protein